ncbi:Crp/Fnr family transcriptional regulator [Vibrio sp. RC27]
MDSKIKEELFTLFPSLIRLDDDLLRRFKQESRYIDVPSGTVLFDLNSPCTAFPLILSGCVRVVCQSDTGRELHLYDVNPGESCIITSSCLLGHSAYPARGVADGQLNAVMIPRALFSKLMEKHPEFSLYIFSLFGERLVDLMRLIEEVSFRKLDQRLAVLLLRKGRHIQTTHQSLADELGSVREIISRLLKNFAEQGIVELGRERITILDEKALEAITV